MIKKTKKIKLYMDGTDFDCEMGNVAVELYASIEELKSKRPCTHECGIVAVTVELVEWVEKGIPYSQRGKKVAKKE
jgi:hypothetical protein